MDESTKRSRDNRQREQDFLAANPKQDSVSVINTQPLIPVFYDDCMVTGGDELSPSGIKPMFVIGRWLADAAPINIIKPHAATCEQFERAHSPDYVRRIFNGAATAIPRHSLPTRMAGSPPGPSTRTASSNRGSNPVR